MKIIITQEEKKALELTKDGSFPKECENAKCKKCPLDCFEVFQLCEDDNPEQVAERILNVAEVK